jgi:hypothetical protein
MALGTILYKRERVMKAASSMRVNGRNSRLKNGGLAPYVTSVKLALASVIFGLIVPAAASASPTAGLRDGDVKNAQKIIAKLRRLEEVTVTPVDFRPYRAEMAGLYPGLFADAAELREGDLKTDLTTAVFLYEAAYRTRLNSGARRTDCDAEVRETYLKLCREIQDGDPARLLLAKARLHLNWADAVVRSYRGVSDSETLTKLSEIEAAREVDLILAEQAAEKLRTVAGRVAAGGLMEAVKAEEFSSEVQSGAISESLSAVERALASLPRGRLYLLLSNACRAYRDGLFWWGKTRHSQGLTVSVNSLAAPDPLKVVGLEADAVSRTVLANWRSALKYTERAETAIGELSRSR